MENIEEFVPPREPYIDNIPIGHLNELIEYFQNIPTGNFIKKSKLVKFNEPSIIAWLEKSFEKIDSPKNGPQSLH